LQLDVPELVRFVVRELEGAHDSLRDAEAAEKGDRTDRTLGSGLGRGPVPFFSSLLRILESENDAIARPVRSHEAALATACLTECDFTRDAEQRKCSMSPP